jgi:hypothetical protein
MDNKRFQQTAQSAMIAARAAGMLFTGLTVNKEETIWTLHTADTNPMQFTHSWSEEYYADLADRLARHLVAGKKFSSKEAINRE